MCFVLCVACLLLSNDIQARLRAKKSRADPNPKRLVNSTAQPSLFSARSSSSSASDSTALQLFPRAVSHSPRANGIGPMKLWDSKVTFEPEQANLPMTIQQSPQYFRTTVEPNEQDRVALHLLSAFCAKDIANNVPGVSGMVFPGGSISLPTLIEMTFCHPVHGNTRVVAVLLYVDTPEPDGVTMRTGLFERMRCYGDRQSSVCVTSGELTRTCR